MVEDVMRECRGGDLVGLANLWLWLGFGKLVVALLLLLSRVSILKNYTPFIGGAALIKFEILRRISHRFFSAF